MKKLIAVLLVVLLAFAGAIGYNTMKNSPAQSTADEVVVDAVSGEAEETEEGESLGITLRSLDREALYAAHEPDEIVASVDGRDVTWDEYFYWLSSGAASVENHMLQMAFYGGGVQWEDPWGDDPDQSFLDYVLYSTEENIKPFAVIENVAKDNGVTLDEEGQARFDEELANHRVQAVGEDGTDEAYAAYLREQEQLTVETLRTLIHDSALYQTIFRALYGENGEQVSDEEALSWLEENGYVRANHILRLTVNMDTNEALGEDEVNQKQAEAAAIAAQLQAIEDHEALLAKVAELKETWDEDSGKVGYPDGYIFTEEDGMDPAFFDAAQALKEYQVSDPVLSQYGYHVIVRLPLEAESVVGYDSDGAPVTARSACASDLYNDMMAQRLKEATLTYAEGFEKPDLTAYLVEESF